MHKARGRGLGMNLIVYGKSFDQDYERAHRLIGRPPGSSYSFQAKEGGFILVFEKGSREEVEKLERHGIVAKLSAHSLT